MKKTLRITGLLVFVAAIGIWLSHGANRGWTKTQTAIPKVDPITEIEYVEYEDKLTFGIELPVGGSLLAILIIIPSFLIHSRTKEKSS